MVGEMLSTPQKDNLLLTQIDIHTEETEGIQVVWSEGFLPKRWTQIQMRRVADRED